MRTGRTFSLTATLLLTALALAACSDSPTVETPDTLTIISHDSFAAGVNDDTFADFTSETGIKVEVKAAGDAGSLVNQAILTKDNPLGDVMVGIDNTFLSRAIGEDLFVPHELDGSVSLVEGLDIDPSVTPLDFGDVCLNYDVAWFEDNDLVPPQTLTDLAAPEYSGLLVVEDPASSSPGLAFLLATIDRFGSEWPGYWESLVANDVSVVSDWDTAYYSSFTRYGGDRPLVVSYASSPPAEVMFATEPLDSAPTGVITDGCFRQIEFAGILANTDHPAAAGDLIDFMLTTEFQAQIPTTWFVFPANGDVELPDVFTENTTIPTDPIALDPGQIEENRDVWINQWHQLVTP